MQNQILTYYLQTLSPVHVGSGVRLRKGLDFFSVGGRTWMVDKYCLETVLADNPKVLDDFAAQEELDIHALSHQYQLDLAQIVATSYRGEGTSRDMFEFVRTGTGLPYLPGSSIKGAIRTVLLWKLSQTQQWQQSYAQMLQVALQAKNEREADNAFMEKSFNIATKNKRLNDANRDLMRVLRVSDSQFTMNDLELADARIFNLISEDHHGWKNIPARRNEREPRRATQLAAESLRIGAAAKVTLTIDEFLLQSAKAQKEAAFGQYSELFYALSAICNEYAAWQIAKQRKFFEKYKLSALVNFYDELENIRTSLPKNEFLLRLSWGSGWQGMTGELIEKPDDLLRIRKKFGLGKSKIMGELPEQCPNCGSKRIRPDNRKQETGYCLDGRHTFPAPGVKKVMFPVFPKTRKIALEGGNPSYPFGWVVMRTKQPTVPPTEDRKHFVPPDYKPSAKTFERHPKVPKSGKLPMTEPKVSKTAPPISKGEKLRAKVINVIGNEFRVRLITKEVGRELGFTHYYLPIKVGDEIEVQVLSTNPAGDQVTKIRFVKYFSK